MSKIIAYSCFIFLFSLISCSSKRKSDIKKLQENKMDFHEMTRYNFEEISYMHPSFMESDVYSNNCLAELSESYISYDLDLEFSVELFSQSRVDVIKYSLDEQKDDLNAVHDYHIKARESSLNEFSTSIKKKLPSKLGRRGFIQIINGNTYDDGDDSSYFVSTVEINGKCYVFQLIGIRENMGYLYDDFMTIISSIEV